MPIIVPEELDFQNLLLQRMDLLSRFFVAPTITSLCQKIQDAKIKVDRSTSNTMDHEFFYLTNLMKEETKKYVSQCLMQCMLGSMSVWCVNLVVLQEWDEKACLFWFFGQESNVSIPILANLSQGQLRMTANNEDECMLLNDDRLACLCKQLQVPNDMYIGEFNLLLQKIAHMFVYHTLHLDRINYQHRLSDYAIQLLNTIPNAQQLYQQDMRIPNAAQAIDQWEALSDEEKKQYMDVLEKQIEIWRDASIYGIREKPLTAFQLFLNESCDTKGVLVPSTTMCKEVRQNWNALQDKSKYVKQEEEANAKYAQQLLALPMDHITQFLRRAK